MRSRTGTRPSHAGYWPDQRALPSRRFSRGSKRTSLPKGRWRPRIQPTSAAGIAHRTLLAGEIASGGGTRDGIEFAPDRHHRAQVGASHAGRRIGKRGAGWWTNPSPAEEALASRVVRLPEHSRQLSPLPAPVATTVSGGGRCPPTLPTRTDDNGERGGSACPGSTLGRHAPGAGEPGESSETEVPSANPHQVGSRDAIESPLSDRR